jgi:hypothetical protein
MYILAVFVQQTESLVLLSFRFLRGNIDKEVALFNGLLQEAREKGDPWAYSSEQRLFDTVAGLERIMLRFVY